MKKPQGGPAMGGPIPSAPPMGGLPPSAPPPPYMPYPTGHPPIPQQINQGFNPYAAPQINPASYSQPQQPWYPPPEQPTISGDFMFV